MIEASVLGDVAALYDGVRPGYPEAVVDQAVRFAGLSTGDAVLEVGAGTGKATVLLARRGFSVTAVEPNPSLCRIARRNCAGFSNVSFETAPFEAWHAGQRKFPLLVAAQSWHWLDAGTALWKAAQLLTSRGAVALLSNAMRLHDAALQRGLDRCTPPRVLAAMAGPWATMARRDLEQSERFSTPRTYYHHWTERYDTRRYLDLMATMSAVRLLPSVDRAQMLDDMAALVDRAGGEVDVAYRTRVQLARVAPADGNDDRCGRVEEGLVAPNRELGSSL